MVKITPAAGHRVSMICHAYLTDLSRSSHIPCKISSVPCRSHQQGSASARYSTRTRNFLSYSNSIWTKHYSDRVESSINSRNFRIISTIIQKQPARTYFRMIRRKSTCSKASAIFYSTLSLSIRYNDKTQFQGKL